MLAAAAERDHDLLALALQVGDVGLELFGIESGGRVELHGAFRRVPVGRGEGDDDDVPLRRNFAQRDGGTRAAVAGPVADQLVAVGRAGSRDRRDRGLRRGRRASATGRVRRVPGTAWLARRALRVGEAVGAAESLGGAGIPGQQGDVLQMIVAPSTARRRPSMRGCCSWDWCWWVRAGNRWRRRRVPPQPPWSPGHRRGTHPGGERVAGRFGVAAVEQRIVQGIVDELGELLRERLHVAVFDDGGRGVEIGRRARRSFRWRSRRRAFPRSSTRWRRPRRSRWCCGSRR